MNVEVIGNDDPRWRWTLNWDEITDRLVVGSCPMRGSDLERIRAEARVSALLSLQHDLCYAHFGIDYGALRRHGMQLGLTLAWHPIRDFDAGDARRRLPGAVRVLDALLRAHERVYVHCTAGMGRSPLAVLGYLVFIKGMLLEEALALLRARRPIVCPNIDAFLACRADLVQRHRPIIEERARRLGLTMPHGDAQLRQRHAELQVLREAVLAKDA